MPVLTKINTNSIAEDAITGDKFAGDAYLSNTANQNISGTYSENRLYTSDAYTLSGNATVNSHLTLSSVKADQDIVLTSGGAYTLTGTGVLEGSSLVTKTPSLTGMIGELGSTVTGTPAITDAPALTGLGTVTSGTYNATIGLSANVNSCAFSASGDNQTIANNTLVKCAFNSEQFDLASCYEHTANYRFTPNIAGKYFILVNVKYNSGTNAEYVGVQLFKNGSLFDACHIVGHDSNVAILVSVVEFNGSSDYIETFFMHQAGSNQSMGPKRFAGYRILE